MSPVSCPNEAENVDPEETREERDDWVTKLLHKYGHSGPAYVLAPMVEQSDLPFRIQCRKYGVNLCFTPMIHSKLFFEQPPYRAKFLPRSDVGPIDRPLIAQLCGHDLENLVYTAKAVAPYCDAVDLNCGCPQMIAKRGRYGAFLLDDPKTLVPLVRELVDRVAPLPVTIKVRLLPTANDPLAIDLPRSIDLYKQLAKAGIQLLTIHGRSRNHKGHNMGAADWAAIRTVVRALYPLPVVANGNVDSRAAADACLRATEAVGVMSAEALLERPTVLMVKNDQSAPMSSIDFAREYLDLCEKYPPRVGGQGTGLKTIRMHLHHFLHGPLQEHAEVRKVLMEAKSVDDLYTVCALLEERKCGTAESDLSWYYRYQSRRKEDEERHQLAVEHRKENPAVEDDEEEESALCFDNLFM